MKAGYSTTRSRSKAGARLPGKTVKKPARRVKNAALVKGTGGKKGMQKAVSLVKLVGITLRMKEHNNHLQGLYAELGKLVYEQRAHGSARGGRTRPAGMEGLVEKIMEMRKKMDRMEREAKLLRSAA